MDIAFYVLFVLTFFWFLLFPIILIAGSGPSDRKIPSKKC